MALEVARRRLLQFEVDGQLQVASRRGGATAELLARRLGANDRPRLLSILPMAYACAASRAPGIDEGCVSAYEATASRTNNTPHDDRAVTTPAGNADVATHRHPAA